MRTPATLRRRLIAGTALAVIVLAGVSGALAWNQYQDNQNRAVGDVDAKVVLASSIIDEAFSGGISTLQAIADAPSVVEGRPLAMDAYFARVEKSGTRFYSGGISWIALSGDVGASSNRTATSAGVSVSDRAYFRQVVAKHVPYVSIGLISKRTKKPTLVVAVPTFGSNGALSGVLTGAISLAPPTTGKARAASEQQTEQLGLEGATILDRDGQVLSPLPPGGRLRRVENTTLFARIQKSSTGTGVIKGTRGLEGASDRIVAFATSTRSGWTIAIDRSESAIYASARRSLILALASLGGAVILILLVLWIVVRRSRRAMDAQGEQVQSWSRLTRKLADSATPSQIADALLESLESGFPDAVVVVDVDSESGEEIRASSKLPGWRRIAGDAPRLRAVADLTTGGPRTRSLEREKPLRELYLAYGRRLKALHSVPIHDQEATPVGSISLMTARGMLEPSEWELLGAVVDQASRALGRARAFEHEHDLAVRLQRSLLPDRLPRIPGINLAGEYLAGGTGVEVGGDWYDAVRRPDGILQLCVGDVSGRGIGAATVMGRQRNIFRAHAYDFASPAEIIKRMLRHVNDDEMVTTAVVSIDLLAGEITYSCAGHPPPLLLDVARGEVVRLDAASAPPVGVAEAADIIEARIQLPEPARLALYTDGLVERRGESIERGIDVLGESMAADASATSEVVLASIADAIGAPSDDVALLLTSVEPVLAVDVELPSEPGMLPGFRRRFRAWLTRRGFDTAEAGEIVLAISEACNNAIEHGYAGTEGSIHLVARIDDGTLHVEITDHGQWHVSEPNDERGRGILLMRSLMHEVDIATTPQGTRVTFARHLGAAVEARAPSVVPAGPSAIPAG
ncbi:MAG TPA: SpoIIE family protein phosphatase [Gaiellaceae bacterium]|nr:SpoIIE family protein phosphatase [Gaiellaceae bacterium]